MNAGAIVEAAIKVVDLISRLVPKRKPSRPKFEPIKLAPKKPLNPHEPKDKS